MTSRSPKHEQERAIEKGRELCPHCGAPLIYRADYRDHLTLKLCQKLRPEEEPYVDPPVWGPGKLRNEPKG